MTSLSFDSTFLSVIIPAFNEENRISRTITRIHEHLFKQDYDAELVVVDDGSTDSTVQTVADLGERVPRLRVVKNGVNRGKGYSVRNGFMNSQGEFLLFSDADLSTPIEEVEKLLGCLQQGYDVAIASRALDDSEIPVRQPWYRELMGKIFNLCVSVLAVRGIRDTQCGFKLFKRECALQVFRRQRIEGFSFDVEALFLARKLGYTVKEVPVVWINDRRSKVSPLKDSVRMFVDLLKIRANDFMGRYR